MPSQTILFSEELQNVPVIDTFYGFPLENYASYGDLYFFNQEGIISGVLESSGKVTRVPYHDMPYLNSESVRCTFREYGYPMELPDSPNVVALINEAAYNGLHIWNANCCRASDKIDLSWMIVLGRHNEDHHGRFPRRIYPGVFMTPENLANRRLMANEELRQLCEPHTGTQRRTLL